MRKLPHSYTNDVRGDAAVVVKRYQGPDATERSHRERLALRALRGRLPVPPVLSDTDDELRLGFLAGVPGQELIDDGRATDLLRSCGAALRSLHAVDPREVWPDARPGDVFVHGDYGPNNLLFEPETLAVTGIVDWEWAHPGQPVEDLAWCEWIVRMHHPAQVDALAGLFDGYGERPGWPVRHETMLARCRDLLRMCERWTPEAVRLWQQRVDIVAAWTE